jgi:hypothetical protein
MRIDISKIRLDGGTQARAEIDETVVNEYASAMLENADFPPIVVVHDGIYFWIVDGFHRFFAHKKNGAKEIEADVNAGTKRDAILLSLSANAKHGLRRSNADKRKAVMTMLDDDEWRIESDNSIARFCAVTQPFVSKLRKEGVITVITPEKKSPENQEVGISEIEEDSSASGDYEVTESENEEKERLNKVYELIENNEDFSNLVEENRCLAEKVSLLESRINGLLAEKNELLKKIKVLQKNKG